MTTTGTEAARFSWMIDDFVDRTPGVTDAVAVSSDGLLMARSRDLERDGSEQLAAIVSGLVSLGNGTSHCFGFGGLGQVIVAMQRGYLFVSSISDGSCVGIVATTSCDIGQVGYQTTRLVEQAAKVLTPALVRELHDEVLRP